MGLFGSGVGFLGLGDTPTAPQMGQNQYGQQYGADRGVAGAGGTDVQQQQQTQGMLSQMAQGGGPNPSGAQMQQGIHQAQQFAQAQANSARGQFGLAGAQHGAMTTAAGAQQQATDQGAILAQQQQWQAIQAQMQMQMQQRAQDLMAMGMDQSAAQAQAQLEAQQNMANQGIAQSNSTAGVGVMGAGLGMLGTMVAGPAGGAAGYAVGSGMH